MLIFRGEKNTIVDLLHKEIGVGKLCMLKFISVVQ